MGRVWLMVFLLVFVLSHLIVLSLSQEDDKGRKNRNHCPASRCGKLGSIQFPFVDKKGPPECGLLKVDGCDSNNQTIQLETGPGKWYISSITQGDTIRIHDEEFAKRLSSNNCHTFNNLTLPSSPFVSFQIISYLTFLRCHPSADAPSYLEPVAVSCSNSTIFYAPPNTEPPPQCELIQLPALDSVKDLPYSSPRDQNISALLTPNFSVNVTVTPECNKCYYHRGGECSANRKNEFYCEKEGMHSGKKNLGLPLGLGIGIGVLILLIVLYVSERRCSASKLLTATSSPSAVCCWNTESHDEKSIESFLRDHGPLAQKRYSYSEIKKMTRLFRDKLGEGGYGGVFKGSLHGGRLVAVKVLKERETRTVDCEEFINEVASISRTSHVNIVALLGFMVEGSKRALVYEFMPNGSLEKYIHHDPLKGNPGLGLETLYQIALGIARGLEYLHRGCNTRILHFDIKPHNILLDDKFHPKISDFGLAKICLQRESIVSMLGARGTPGYIAPEVFCRNFGGVSYKSDVYSYGMMVLEMVVGRQNISTEVDNSSDVYFPDWIYKRLELGDELGVHRIRNEEENQLARRMVIASLWCIQTKPPDRPPMSRVIEMIQDTFQPLAVPPKPSWSYSPPRFPEVSGSISSITLVPDESLG